MDHYKNVQRLFAVEVGERFEGRHQLSMEIPLQESHGQPILVSKQLRGEDWEMDSVEVVTPEGFLVRFCEYRIRSEQKILYYKLNTPAICYHLQYQGNCNYLVTKKRTISLYENHYHILSLKRNYEKILFNKGVYRTVELYCTSSAMGDLRSKTCNFGSIDRKQQISKMQGESVFYGPIRPDIDNVIKHLAERVHQEDFGGTDHYKCTFVNLVTQAIRGENNYVKFNCNIQIFDFCVNWKVFVHCPTIAENALSAPESILIKSAAGTLLIQSDSDKEFSLWNLVSYFRFPFAIYLSPGRSHYALLTSIRNNLVFVHWYKGVAAVIVPGNDAFLEISSGPNIFHFNNGISHFVLHCQYEMGLNGQSYKEIEEKLRLHHHVQQYFPNVNTEYIYLIYQELVYNVKVTLN
ncbi:hypothetical protein [Olivibacter jilunii]|uniref:hypothetical protein n=1 Tax=Olivibacter jilunii TaxID=985016 RepID=UPI001030C08B|nr:hypothetical protein [Olivibacter jilunii]